MKLKSNKGFLSIDVLFALFILSIVSILFIYVLNNNMKYLNRNKLESELRLESQNIIDSLNNDKDNKYLKQLTSSLRINIREGNIIMDVEKTVESERLWRLNIRAHHKENIKLMNEWVIVVESPKS